MSIRHKLQNNIFYVINLLTGRVAALERQMMRMQEEMDRKFAIQRQHLVRVKNNQELPDAFIQNGRPYHDLSPEKAWKLFQDPEFDFIFLDVSHEEFVPEGTRPRATLHIPLEQLEARWDEVPQQTTPLMIISEEGLRSIRRTTSIATMSRVVGNSGQAIVFIRSRKPKNLLRSGFPSSGFPTILCADSPASTPHDRAPLRPFSVNSATPHHSPLATSSP
jgi:hypothetical protein